MNASDSCNKQVDPALFSPRFIIGAQYFVYFGILGMFLPYFNLYCHHIGFSGIEIGTLSALRSITLVLFPPVWGWLADRFQIRRRIYIACIVISTAIWVFYLLTADFWLMFLITAFYGVFYAPIISFLETFTMETLGRARESYGKIRAWGSGSFILIVVVLGLAIDIFSVDIILFAILAGSVILALFSLKIPTVKITAREPSPPHGGTLFRKRVILFLVCAFLMLVSHATYYGFFSIHLEALGYGNAFIGVTWALASAAEILVMIRSERIFRRFSLENVLLFSFMVAALRWFALYVVSSPVGILLTQVLHAVTYGTFHMASILYIDQLSSERTKTLGQAVNNAVTYGLGLMVGFFFNGWLYETAGASLLFAISGMIALTGGLLFKGMQGDTDIEDW